MTVVPLFCAKLINMHQADEEVGEGSIGARFGWICAEIQLILRTNAGQVRSDAEHGASQARRYACRVDRSLAAMSCALSVSRRLVFSANRSRPIRDQPESAFRNARGTHRRLCKAGRRRDSQVVPPSELQIIVSNIGITTDFSAIYTPNSASHTAFVQVSLKEGHKVGSYEYMRRVREQLSQKLPQLSTYFQSGGLVDAVINLGLPAPIDIQVSGNHLNEVYATASKIAAPVRALRGVSDVLIPQDIDYPALELDVDREKAGLLGFQKEIVDNVITALTSNSMIAPNYWIDPRSGNPYLLTVQYPESAVKSLTDLKQIPLRGVKSIATDVSRQRRESKIDSFADGSRSLPIVSRYRRLRFPEKPGSGRSDQADRENCQGQKLPEGVRVNLRGSVQGMRASFKSFGIGLILSVVLVYLVLVAQFARGKTHSSFCSRYRRASPEFCWRCWRRERR